MCRVRSDGRLQMQVTSLYILLNFLAVKVGPALMRYDGNREEGLAEQLCDLAVKQGGGDALMTMLWQQATGVFFTASSPQWRFGGSAISYLVVFDMELLLHRLLRDEKDELFKAVNDTRAMHDKQTLLDALSDDGAKGEYRDYKAHPKAEAAPRGYRTTDPNTEYLPLHAAVACGNTRM